MKLVNDGKFFVSWKTLQERASRLQDSVFVSDVNLTNTVLVLEKELGGGWFNYSRRHIHLGEIGRGCIKLY